MANKNTVQEAFPVLGMSCASCAARIDKTLNHQPGVSKAAVKMCIRDRVYCLRHGL